MHFCWGRCVKLFELLGHSGVECCFEGGCDFFTYNNDYFRCAQHAVSGSPFAGDCDGDADGGQESQGHELR